MISLAMAVLVYSVGSQPAALDSIRDFKIMVMLLERPIEP